MPRKKLTPKQDRFIDEYLKCLNVKHASTRSGQELIHSINSFKEKYYVYFLIDPEDMSIFYVGKGSGKRMMAHCKSRADSNYIKLERINEIKRKGNSVIEAIFSTHDDEGEALCVERNLIKNFADFGLTNISSGTRSSKESAIAKLDVMINSFKSYDHWVGTVSKETYALVEKLFGCPMKFHERLKNEMIEHRALIENNGDLGNGWYYDFAKHEVCLQPSKKNSA